MHRHGKASAGFPGANDPRQTGQDKRFANIPRRLHSFTWAEKTLGDMMASQTKPPVDPVDEILPPLRMTTLGLQHVLVMYAGAVAVPLIVGRALKLSPEDVAFLISADLFCCGIATIIQSLGATRWFGIQLPVMMGVTFASVGPTGFPNIQLMPTRISVTPITRMIVPVTSGGKNFSILPIKGAISMAMMPAPMMAPKIIRAPSGPG